MLLPAVKPLPAMASGSANLQTCVLDRIVEGDGERYDGTLIGLHDQDSMHVEVLPLLRSVADGRRVIAPRSARWSSLEDGGRFSWFSSVAPPLIEPIGFGDGLIQLERLAFEYAAANSTRGTVVLGIGQGATMALALGALWPELFKGVIAIDGTWPNVPGWTVPETDMAGVRALLVAGTDDTRSELLRRGAIVVGIDAPQSKQLTDPGLTATLRQWMVGETI